MNARAALQLPQIRCSFEEWQVLPEGEAPTIGLKTWKKRSTVLSRWPGNKGNYMHHKDAQNGESCQTGE